VSALSKERKALIQRVETLKAKKNSVSQEIGGLKAKAKTDPSAAAAAENKVAEMKKVGDEVSAVDVELRAIEEKFADIAMSIPNIPDASVPVGKTPEENKEVRRVGTPRKFDFTPLDHTDIGEKLGILDFERAGKLSGARFAVYLGAGATLERALIQF